MNHLSILSLLPVCLFIEEMFWRAFLGARNRVCVCEEYNSAKVYILYPEDVSSLSVYLVVCIFPYLSFNPRTLEP